MLCLFWQVEHFLKLCLVDSLCRKVLRIVVCKNILVRFGVIVFNVNTVEYAHKLEAALSKNIVKSVAEPRVKNFVCVGRAYGCNHICGFDCALHQVDTAVVLNKVLRAGLHTQNISDKLHTVNALILDVVDCENRFDVFPAGLVGIHCGVVNGSHRRLPVVTMDNIGLEADVGDYFKNCTGEESKPLRIVIVAVDTVTLEIILVVDKVVDYTACTCLKNAAVLSAPRNGHGNVRNKLH